MQCCVSCLSKRKLDGSLQIQEFSYQQFSFQKFSHLEFSLQKFSNLEFSLQQLSNLQYICASNFLTCNEIVLPIFTPATKKILQFIKIKFFQLSILQLISHPIFAHLIFPHPHKIPPIFMIPLFQRFLLFSTHTLYRRPLSRIFNAHHDCELLPKLFMVFSWKPLQQERH